MAKRNVLLLCPVIALGATAVPAEAQVNFSIGVEIGPPPARVEIIPAPRPGFVWAPGYWAWNGGE
ncbi:MAG: YXWGXW repeat-containing protein [Betaproteobacteria bacterium]|nr:YXWGXW repeat-containing protein [Betaproteobacteria bacterium]